MTPDKEGDGTPANVRTLGRGEFFAVDHRSFSRASRLGLNPAVAYLTIARGAGTRPTSCWSVDAIERHTGMSRSKAKRAIQDLVDEGLLTRGGAPTRPVYGVVPAHQLDDLSAVERDVIKRLSAGPRIMPRRYERAADRLVLRGHLSRDAMGYFSIEDLSGLDESRNTFGFPMRSLKASPGKHRRLHFCGRCRTRVASTCSSGCTTPVG
jgi:hypothetical protein